MRGDSFRRQSELATRYAKTHGLDLDTSLTFQDLGVSAYHGRNLEVGKLGEFLNAVQAGLVEKGSFLLVESLDRISRESARKALRTLEDICDEGINLVTMADGRVYSKENLDSDPTSLIMSILIFMRANEESATKARRLRASWDSKRKKATSGTPLTSLCPSWLRVNADKSGYEVIEERAKIVRRIFRMTLDEGRGKHFITTTLNREGVPTFEGASMWNRSYIHKLLHNSAVCGTLTPHTSSGRKKRTALDPIPNHFPAIISQEEFMRVQDMASESASPLRGRHAGLSLQNLFGGGLLRCPLCGSAVIMTNKGKKSRRRLVCRSAKNGAGCSYFSVLYSQFEEAFLRDADYLIGSCPSGDEKGQEIETKISNIDAGLSALTDQLENLTAAIARGNTQPQAVLRKIDEIETVIETQKSVKKSLEEELAATSEPLLAHRLNLLDEAVATLDSNDPNRSRTEVNARLREMCSAIVLDYPNGRGVIHWKSGGKSFFQYGLPAEALQQES